MSKEIQVIGRLSKSGRQVFIDCPYCQEQTPTGRLSKKKKTTHIHGVPDNDKEIIRTPHCSESLWLNPYYENKGQFHFKVIIPENGGVGLCASK